MFIPQSPLLVLSTTPVTDPSILLKKKTNKQNEHNRNINHAILNADLVRQSVDICKQ